MNTKKVLEGIISVAIVLAILDVMILFTGLSQIAFEGRTGYWNLFWRTQAEFVVQHIIK